MPALRTELLALYAAAIVGASLLGGVLPMLVRFTHRRLQVALSFVAGVMLGVALFHLLPHAVLESLHHGDAGAFGHGDFDRITLATVAGFLVMFLVERFLPFHSHEPAPEAGGAAGHGDHCDHAGHGHHHGHGAEHSRARPHRHGAGGGVSPMAWVGAAVGMGIHALLEGVALAASVALGDGAWAGFGTFLVILLHKPFDSMTVATLFHLGGPRRRLAVHLLNAGFALLVPLGAILFLAGPLAGGSPQILVLALAFSAGTFLCISTSDLLPELQFHRHDRLALSASLIAGLAIAFGIGLLEGASHDHHHGPGPGEPAAGGVQQGSGGAAAHDHAHDHDHDHAHDHDHDHDHDHP